MALVAVFAAGACVSAVSQHQRTPFLPFDEASQEPSLFATRAALLEALRRGNAAAIGRWLGSAFNGSPDQREGMVAELASNSDWVEELTDILTHGGAFSSPERNRFCAPYWVVRPPDAQRLPPQLVSETLPWVVVVSESVVRERPDASAPELGRLSLELVLANAFAATGPSQAFIQVEFGGRRAFVERSDLREVEGASTACFDRKADRWTLTSYQ